MEAEKDDNPLKPSFYVLYAVAKIVFVAFCGYLCLPAIVNSVQVVIVWLEWFRFVFINVSIVFIFVVALIALIYVLFRKNTQENKPDDDLYDQYIAAVPTVVRPSPANHNSVTDFGGFDDVYNYNNSTYKDIVPAFEAVEAVRESHCCGDRVEMELNTKSYRRTRSEKKTRSSTVEYRRTESQRETKAASWRSQTMDGLTSEQFRTTVETFIIEKKMSFQQNGVVDQWRNGVPQWQNGVVDHWRNGVPQWQNGVVDHWRNGVPQLQSGVVDQLTWPNGVADQWQRQADHYDGSGLCHRHRSRRLMDGPGSTGSGSLLAISN